MSVFRNAQREPPPRNPIANFTDVSHRTDRRRTPSITVNTSIRSRNDDGITGLQFIRSNELALSNTTPTQSYATAWGETPRVIPRCAAPFYIRDLLLRNTPTALTLEPTLSCHKRQCH